MDWLTHDSKISCKELTQGGRHKSDLEKMGASVAWGAGRRRDARAIIGMKGQGGKGKSGAGQGR